MIDSRIITLNSSINSDFQNLKIEPEYNNSNRIITFSKGYISNNIDLIDYEFVYFYSDDLNLYSTQLVSFNCYKYNSIEDEEYNKSQSYEIVASIVSSDENIYKAVVLTKTADLFKNTKLHFYNYVLFDMNNVLLETINFESDILFSYNLNDPTNNIWSCIVYDYIPVEVKGKIGYFQFDSTSNFNPWGFLNLWKVDDLFKGNYVDLFFAFFDVVDNNVEWDDSKTIHRIDYSITETKKKNINKYTCYKESFLGILMPEWKRKFKSSHLDILTIKTYEDSVLNKDYKFTYPVDLTFDNFDEWIKNGFIVEDEVTYSGIWKTSDTKLSDNLELSSGYNSSLLANYNYACRVGSMIGYPRVIKESNMYYDWLTPYVDVTTEFYSLDVDFKYIYYIENGESFICKVDKTTLEDIGYIGNEEDIKNLEIPIKVRKNVNTGFNIWNLIGSVFAIGLLLVLVVLVLRVVKFFRDIKLRKDVRKMKKENKIRN